MKVLQKLLLFMLISFSIKASYAQVTVTLNVDSHPSPQISEWVDRTNLAILTVTNTDEHLEGLEYKVKAKMFIDGDLIAETNNNVITQTLELGSQTFLADEIIPYEALIFHNRKYENQIIQTGMLPAGEYQFCVSLIDLDGEVISTPEIVCQPMIITAYQMPELLMPIDDQEITSQLVPTIVFRWSPMTPTPSGQDGLKYIIAVSKVGDGQSPSQAFHVNYPIIEEEVLAGTQFIWPTDLDAPEENTQYVWSVKPVSFEDNPYKSGANGFVDVETFKITVGGTKGADDDSDDECECDNPSFENPPITITRLYPEDHPNVVSIIGLEPTQTLLHVCDTDNPSDYIMQTLIDWDGMHLFDTPSDMNNATHDYSPNVAYAHEVPEEICITIKKMGTNSCVKEYCIEVPQEIRNAINGTADCGCTNQITEPELTLTQPEPNNYPRKLELGNVTQLRDFVRECNAIYNEIDAQYVRYKYTFDTTINWDTNHSAEAITNNGPFEHEYTLTDEIPSEICINIAIDPKPGYEGESCVR